MPRLPALLTTYRNTFVSPREARLSHAPLFGHQCEDRQPPGLFRSIGFLRRGRFVFAGSLVTRCARTRLRHAVRILGGACIHRRYKRRACAFTAPPATPFHLSPSF